MVPAPYVPPTGCGLAVIVPEPTVVKVNTSCFNVKVAVTLLAASIVTLQLVALPEHVPAQLLNTEFGPGVAVRVTSEPAGYFPANGPGVGMAAMDPFPMAVSTSAYWAVNVAVTLLAASIVTLQLVVLPEHAPAQPVNTELGPGAAVRVTSVPAGYFPGSGPGVGTAAMDPSPSAVSANAYCAVKVALTFLAAFIVTVQGFVLPEQSPDQALN